MGGSGNYIAFPRWLTSEVARHLGKKGVAGTLCVCSECCSFEPCSGPGKCYFVQMNYSNCFRIFVRVFMFNLLSLLKKIK